MPLRLKTATLCVIQNIQVSSLMGIPVNTIVPLVYWLGGFFGVIGGILLGLIEVLAAAYLGSGFKDAVGYFAIVLILLFKPDGLFGKKKAVKV